MIKKYRFGDPFETEAVVENIQAEHGEPKFGETSIDNGFSFSYMMDEDEIVRYTESGEPMDKAGAYGIQGKFASYVKEIHGDYNNVVGLPVGRLYQELKALGILEEIRYD